MPGENRLKAPDYDDSSSRLLERLVDFGENTTTASKASITTESGRLEASG